MRSEAWDFPNRGTGTKAHGGIAAQERGEGRYNARGNTGDCRLQSQIDAQEIRAAPWASQSQGFTRRIFVL